MSASRTKHQHLPHINRHLILCMAVLCAKASYSLSRSHTNFALAPCQPYITALTWWRALRAGWQGLHGRPGKSPDYQLNSVRQQAQISSWALDKTCRLCCRTGSSASLQCHMGCQLPFRYTLIRTSDSDLVAAVYSEQIKG